MTPAELRAIRVRLNLTQQALADLLGVHKVTVAHWEAGTRAIQQQSAMAIRYVELTRGEARPEMED